MRIGRGRPSTVRKSWLCQWPGVGSNPDHRGRRPVINCLSNGMAPDLQEDNNRTKVPKPLRHMTERSGSSPVGPIIVPSSRRPDRLWGHPSLLLIGYRGLFPLGVKRPVREAIDSPTSSTEVKKTRIYTSLPHTSSWRSASLRTGTALPYTRTLCIHFLTCLRLRLLQWSWHLCTDGANQLL
jgi:hypothetical protein